MSTTALTKVGTKNAEQVVLLDAAGDQVTSFGGGTQYADGAAAATPTGTQANWNESGTQRAVSLTKALPVQPGTGATFPVSAASLPLPALAATSTKQSDGSQKSQIVDGSGNVIAATSNALNVHIASGASSGTEYTEDAAAAANPSGPMTMAVRADSLAGVTTTDGDNIAARATDKGELYVKHVDSIPVTGTFYQATQPVSGTVTAAQATAANLNMTEANSAAIKTAVEILDNAISGSEMQVDVVTSALPSGASTAAKQPALGTAGTASADVITVQGIASMTALKVDGSGVTQPVSGTVTVTATNLDVQSGGADLATSTQAGAIQTAVELIDDTVKVLGTDTYTEAATKGLVIGAVRRDADTTLVDTTNEIGPVQMNAAGQLKVEVFSGETLPVSLTSTTVTGTVAVTQSGTWDEVGINDSGNSITVDAPVGTPAFVRLSDGAAAISTLPVSLASVPSHAVTNAGTFAVQVDGNALTALQLIDDGVATVASAITTKGMAAVGTDGTNARILKTDTSGELQVDVLTMPTVTVNAHAVTNAGTFAVQVDGNALTALQKIDDPVLVDDAAFTPATSSVTMAGFQADETATDSVDEGDAGAARMTLDRKVIVTVQPHTAGGWSVANCTTGDTFTALTNSAQVIKASAGSFGGYYYYNPNATASYINVYDVAAASVTVGTTTPKLTYCIPPTAAANIEIVHGIPFGTAMSASATTTGGGNTAPSTALEVMFWYK